MESGQTMEVSPDYLEGDYRKKMDEHLAGLQARDPGGCVRRAGRGCPQFECEFALPMQVPYSTIVRPSSVSPSSFAAVSEFRKFASTSN